jgi:hypothetical protein
MNNASERDQLLGDVLSEGGSGEFREAMLAETLRLARRRRVYRRARSISAVLALLAVGAFFGRREWPAESRFVPQAPENFVLVRTQPLAAEAVIRTRPLDQAQCIASFSGAPTVGTARSAFHVIGDRELLALASPRPAILIRSGPSSEELEFANAEDQEAGLTE